MVMNFTVFDASLHMTNHYRRINSAKCVVNTSAPRCYNHRSKCSSDKGSTSRLSTASVLSNYGRVPSRTNSNCEVRRGAHNHSNLLPAGRSSSVPPRPVSKRNPSGSAQRKPKLQMTKAPSKKKKLPPNIDTKTNDSPKHAVAREHTEDAETNVHVNEQSSCDKKPIPTPRTLSQLHAPLVASLPDYEYLQFSLRVTEDIIRNDLYSPREMRRVFNSHIEANRDRLSMTKMLSTVENLCKELNISKKPSRHIVNHEQFHAPCCSCGSDEQQPVRNTDILSPGSKRSMMEGLVSGQYEITDEDIRGFSEQELQQVITGIMSDASVDEYHGYDGLRNLVVPPLISSRSTEETVEIPQVSFRSSNTSSVDVIRLEGNSANQMLQANSGCSIQSVQVTAAAPSSGNVAQETSVATPLSDIKSSQLVCGSQLLDQCSRSCVHGARKFSGIAVMGENDNAELIKLGTTLANDAGTCESAGHRSRSLLAEAETALKQVIWKIPLRSSAQEMQASTVVTSTPVTSASNVSVESLDMPNCLLSVEASQPALLTVADTVYDSSKSNNASIMSAVQKTDENNTVAESAANSSDAGHEPSEQQIFANSGESKQQRHEVSINTEQSLVDSCTQYDLVNMENCLELGIDKCTQTLFYDEEPQHLKVPGHTSGDSSSGVSVACTSSAKHCAKDDCTAVPHRADSGVTEKESVAEVTPVASSQLLSGADNVRRLVSTDTRMSRPPSELVSTIKQMLVDNVTALSEIMHTPRRGSQKSELAVTNGYNDVSISEGEITVISSDRARMKSSKDVSNWSNYVMTNMGNRCECKVLNQLKKYEHGQSVPGPEPTNISLSDYELKTCENIYAVGAGRRDSQYSYRNMATVMPPHSHRKFSGGGRPLCSDGELASSSAASDYDTRTDTS